jgi:two-component system phosphate regulon sensor histidine kinase PhoR
MVAALAVCAVLIVRELEAFHADELTEHLNAQAVTLRNMVRGQIKVEQSARLDQIAKEVGENEADGLRVTFIATDGTVLGDSQADISQMDSHHDRQEIRAALDTGWGESTRWSDTLSRRLKYVAVRVGSREDPVGVVRVALAVKTIGARTQAVRRMIWVIAIVAMAATAVFALILARLWTMPIRRITRIAARLSRGDLSARAGVRGSDELARLARSLNEMGDHLDKQLSTIDGQRQALEALLDQLDEGVVVAGPDGKIILSNPAAARLLHPDNADQLAPRSWVGRRVEQCVPQHDLQRLLLGEGPAQTGEVASVSGAPSGAGRSDGRPGDEVRLELHRGASSVTLLARGSDIEISPHMVEGGEQSASGKVLAGRILALTDITQIARTIQMKTDFVANASHELRTPLSAIRAAIETVMNADTDKDAESARRFLRIIDRHSARLEALVADLLALSRLESPSRETEPAAIDVRGFCGELGEKWADRVNEKQLRWNCTIPSGLCEITADEDLVRMVLDNLIDNAIKFTDRGGHVSVTFRREQGAVVVEVADNGCGIAPQDQERVFERFYQVAQARSDAEGSAAQSRGTGLGLAIVRHAVASMGGTVSLASELGIGTGVTVRIPQAS